MNIDRRELLDWMMFLPMLVKIQVYAIFSVDLGFGMSSIFASMIEFNEMYRFINSITDNFLINDARMKTFLEHIAPLYKEYNMDRLRRRERKKGEKNFKKLVEKSIAANKHKK